MRRASLPAQRNVFFASCPNLDSVDVRTPGLFGCLLTLLFGDLGRLLFVSSVKGEKVWGKKHEHQH